MQRALTNIKLVLCSRAPDGKRAHEQRMVSTSPLAAQDARTGGRFKQQHKSRYSTGGASPMNPRAPLCPYCGQPAMLIESGPRYRPEYGPYWSCDPCDARVGVHRGTVRPLGRLANAELRAARIRAHAAFDPLWHRTHTAYPERRNNRNTLKRIGRTRAYQWLAEHLGVAVSACHIGDFDVAQCARVVQLIEQTKITPVGIRHWAKSRR